MPRARKGRVGRPKTSPLNRAEQLRAAKRAQRARERREGLLTIPVRVEVREAVRLRALMRAQGFDRALARFLDEELVDLDAWPTLREIAWNRTDRWISAEEALALYERNWRFVDPKRLTRAEAELIERLKDRVGAGVLHV